MALRRCAVERAHVQAQVAPNRRKDILSQASLGKRRGVFALSRLKVSK
eukprot:CAMPEP_0180432642 /NCGR_PEP_ID=MMETSP1036_2-20121128/9017_1 /TAXON_ID=632150 /ORGANISM="Azadinium spinosum, Strain 3D9" /LENGTH=47 /DNA_ID= /DNA_START= /DNA_END= /DNA_ORIENTATION=